MIKLGQYILAGRLQAMAMLSLFSLLSLLIPPLSYLFASVVVALVTLRHGTTAAMQTMIGALLILQVFVLFTPIPELIPTVYALLIWLPVYICSLVLRISYSQTVMILAGITIAAIIVLSMHVLIADVPAWWQEKIMQLFILLNLPSEIMAEYKDALSEKDNFVSFNGQVIGLILAHLVTSIFFARWWQSLLFNQGGFKKEFFNLVFPPALAVLMIVCLFSSIVFDGKLGLIGGDLGSVLLFAFLFEGLSKIHQKVQDGSLHAAMLFGLYFLLINPFTMFLIVLFLAIIGVTDSIKTYKSKYKQA